MLERSIPGPERSYQPKECGMCVFCQLGSFFGPLILFCFRKLGCGVKGRPLRCIVLNE